MCPIGINYFLWHFVGHKLFRSWGPAFCLCIIIVVNEMFFVHVARCKVFCWNLAISYSTKLHTIDFGASGGVFRIYLYSAIGHSIIVHTIDLGAPAGFFLIYLYSAIGYSIIVHTIDLGAPAGFFLIYLYSGLTSL